MKEHTAILSVVMLTLEAFKLVPSLTAIIIATTTEGIVGFIALLWSCLCLLHSNWTKMRRRAEKGGETNKKKGL